MPTFGKSSKVRYSKRRGKLVPKVNHLAAEVRKLKSATEVKTFDVGFYSPADRNGHGTNFINIPTGNTDGSRVGTKINISKIHMRMCSKLIENSPDAANQVIRVLLVVDKQSNGQANGGAYGNLLITDLPDIDQFPQLWPYDSNRVPERYRVLFDKSYQLYFDGYTQGQFMKTWSKRFKKPIQVQYTEAVQGTYEHIVKNNIYMLVFSDIDDVDKSRNVATSVRLEYTDA